MAGGTKRRNSEKRKEKSRDAARCRRGKEAEIFADLASQLPLSQLTIDQLDKASVMRLLLSALKIYAVLGKHVKQECQVEDEEEAKIDHLYPKALEGFLLVLSKEGDIIYVAETVAKYLGIQQIDLMGQSIYEFAHPCDHEDLQDMLSTHHRGADDEPNRSVLIRLKCTLTSKGRSVNLKSATYKVIRLSGKYVTDEAVDELYEEMEDVEMMDADDDDDKEKICRHKPMPHLIAIGEPIPHPSNIEVPLDKRTFTSRHQLNMRFTDCDDRIKHLIGYNHEEMIGTSLFGYHHALDSKMMEKAFRDLFSKGQTCTEQYRFMAKNGGYVWVVTQATVIFNSRTQKPQCVVCVHYVLSHVEQHGRILANVQVPVSVKKEEKKPKIQMPILPKLSKFKNKQVMGLLNVPKFSTEDVFGEKTEDMEQDFYFPPGMKRTEGGHTDLSHLAPQDGSVCIPLEMPPSQLVKHVESFASGLSLYDDLPGLDPVFKDNLGVPVKPRGDSPKNNNNNRRMETDSSPSPALATINAKDLQPRDDVFMNTNSSDSDIDFDMRAPFIPMSAEEDFLLSQPTEECLLNMGADFNPGIFGCTESVFNLKDELYDGPPPDRRSQTPQEMIGGSTVKASIERPQDKMMMRLKRPLNRSCLEKGPPLKITKYQGLLGQQASGGTGMPLAKDSRILMDLLLTGEDKKHGYSVLHKNISNQKEQSGYLRNLLSGMTRQEAERALGMGGRAPGREQRGK